MHSGDCSQDPSFCFTAPCLPDAANLTDCDFHNSFAFGVLVPLILSTCNFYLVNVSLCCGHLACQFNPVCYDLES